MQWEIVNQENRFHLIFHHQQRICTEKCTNIGLYGFWFMYDSIVIFLWNHTDKISLKYYTSLPMSV